MTIAWITLLVLIIIVEAIALIKKKPDETLTYHIRKWFSLRGHGKLWWLRRGALGVFALWLAWHFFVE